MTSKGQQRRETIVAAAAHLLVELGPDAVNHRAVAAAAETALGTVTYHFAGAEDLRRAAVDAVVAADVRRMTLAIGGVPVVRRNAEETAAIVVELVAPGSRTEMVAWYERYARGARDPVLAEAARTVNAAARARTSDALSRCGRATAPPADIVLAVVDGAILGALVAGSDAAEARRRATAALAFVLRGG
jgi:DNA-binding transcriptional regulator YbjK